MVIRTRYDIDQKVGIVDLKNHPAQIHQIRIDGKNLFYDINYWDGMELRDCSVCEHELSDQYEEVI